MRGCGAALGKGRYHGLGAACPANDISPRNMVMTIMLKSRSGAVERNLRMVCAAVDVLWLLQEESDRR
jgi:hypothetical protein